MQSQTKVFHNLQALVNRRNAVALLTAIALLLSNSQPSRAAITWIENPNPIFGQWIGGPQAYYPSVLYDAGSFSGHDGGYSSIYKMWYDTGSRTALAISNDGYTWTDLGATSLSYARHPTVEYYPAGFSGANSGVNPSSGTMYYRLWYWYAPSSSPYGISVFHYAESDDGITWYNDQPLQNGTVKIITDIWPDWNRGTYGPADILYNVGNG